MRMIIRLRRHWQECLLATIVLLPWLSLLVLGLVWLWQEKQILPWALAAAVLGVLAWPVRRSMRRRMKKRARADLMAQAQPSPGWGPVGRQAWEDVQALAEATPALSFLEQDPAIAAARQTVETVARRFFPDDKNAWARFTLPEALLLAERVARDLRRKALQHVGGSRAIRLDHLLWLKRQNDRYGTAARTTIKVGHGLWRMARIFVNPPAAIAQELQKVVLDETGGLLSYRVRTYATRTLVLEIGRAAIDLYSGNLSLSDEELAAARTADQAGVTQKPEAPVRLVLAGQVNAGKSSTINAMAGEVLCEVSPLPTPTGTVEHILSSEGQPAVIMVDTPGLTSGGEAGGEILRQGRRADMILWVASAVQPARAADVVALKALRAQFAGETDRRPPPLLVVLTHIDQLRPAAEWSPPYDMVAPHTAKETSIQLAMAAVARTFDVPLASVIAVAALHGQPPYHHEALWARIAMTLDEAKLRQIERLRIASSQLSLRKLAGQVGQSGVALARAVIRG